MEVALNTNIVELNINDVSPFEGSHNTDDVVNMIAESLKVYGFQQPIIVDKNKVVICGNALYKAAKQLGIEKIPCSIIENLTDEQVAQYRIADNKTSEFARWNEKKLTKELTYLHSPLELQFCFDEDLNRKMGFTMPVIKQSSQKGSKSDKEKEQSNKKSDKEKDKEFREQIKSVDANMVVQPPKYFTYTCSKCGKNVSIKV